MFKLFFCRRNLFILHVLVVVHQFALFEHSVVAQERFHSHNGYALPTEGVLRALVVFAEVDSTYEYYYAKNSVSKVWKPREMPINASSLLDTCVLDKPVGSISKYFHYASLGNLSIIGDYYPKLLTIKKADLRTLKSNRIQVVKELDKIFVKEGDILTNSGYSIKTGDFDNLKTTRNSIGKQKNFTPDKSIDLLIIIYRCSPKLGFQSGFASYYETMKFANFNGLNSSVCLSSNSLGSQIIVHEISHLFLGPNSFHNGGLSAGTRKVIHNHSGHGMISANGTNMSGVSAWDRYRLGWRKDSSVNLISDSSNLKSDLTMDDIIEDDLTFTLRDFLIYGDAVRIKIPYVGDSEYGNEGEKQWIWITNHQSQVSNENGCKPKGLRINIQVGNDDFQSARSATNYFVPLNSRGNYDFEVDYATKTISTNSERENKFTGMNISQYPLYYTNTSKFLKGDDSFMAKQVVFNADTLKEDSCCYLRYPYYGTMYDSFLKDNAISLNSNPAPVNILSGYLSKNGPSGFKNNNESVYLNTLSVEVLKVDTVSDSIGDIYTIGISKNHKIDKSQRWCGQMFLHDSLHLTSQGTISISRGLTPTRVRNPIFYDDTLLYTSASVLTCNANSVLSIGKKSKLVLEAGSTLQLDSLSTLQLQTKSKILVKDSSLLVFNNGAKVAMSHKSKIIFKGKESRLFISDKVVFTGEESLNKSLKAKGKYILEND